MFKIDCIKSHSDVSSRSFVDKKTGETKQMHSQNLFAHLGGPFPETISVSIDDPLKPIELGSYTLSPTALKVGQYGRLEFDSFNIANSLIRA
jgi:hypothetical protein